MSARRLGEARSAFGWTGIPLSQHLLPLHYLLLDFFRSGRSGQIASLQCLGEVKPLANIHPELLLDGLKFLKRELIQGFAQFFPQFNQRANCVMRSTKWQTFANKIICKVGSE